MVLYIDHQKGRVEDVNAGHVQVTEDTERKKFPEYLDTLRQVTANFFPELNDSIPSYLRFGKFPLECSFPPNFPASFAKAQWTLVTIYPGNSYPVKPSKESFLYAPLISSWPFNQQAAHIASLYLLLHNQGSTLQKVFIDPESPELAFELQDAVKKSGLPVELAKLIVSQWHHLLSHFSCVYEVIEAQMGTHHKNRQRRRSGDQRNGSKKGWQPPPTTKFL